MEMRCTLHTGSILSFTLSLEDPAALMLVAYDHTCGASMQGCNLVGGYSRGAFWVDIPARNDNAPFEGRHGVVAPHERESKLHGRRFERRINRGCSSSLRTGQTNLGKVESIIGKNEQPMAG